MLNFNGETYTITQLGITKFFYYFTVSSETNSFEYELDVNQINKDEELLPQLYNYILTTPQFSS